MSDINPRGIWIIFSDWQAAPHLNRDPGTEEVSITLTDTIWFTLALSSLIKPYHWTIPVDLSVRTLIILISAVFLQLSNKQTEIITFAYRHTFAINIWYFASEWSLIWQIYMVQINWQFLLWQSHRNMIDITHNLSYKSKVYKCHRVWYSNSWYYNYTEFLNFYSCHWKSV